jgi:hypothetical protein
MTCWKVGRFVQRADSGRNPNVMRSFVASSRQCEGSAACCASSFEGDAPADSGSIRLEVTRQSERALTFSTPLLEAIATNVY